MINAYILRGGILPGGVDGPVSSAGMDSLARQLRGLNININTMVYNWGDTGSLLRDLANEPNDRKAILIGYSGGGSRATWVANSIRHWIDLMVLYDPSPKWQMQPIGKNVRKAICYHNLNPMMPSFYGMLGGGLLTGSTKIEIVEISEQHLLVQADQRLHDRTLAAVKELK